MAQQTSTADALRSARSLHGQLPLKFYGALGDGRSVALSGSDGSLDWWCVPHMDSPPLFDRLLDASVGGFFHIEPVGDYRVERRYATDSNVLETRFVGESGTALLVESLNSGPAGRLPWAELARRIEGISGTLKFKVQLRLGHRGGSANPYLASIGRHRMFQLGPVSGLFLCTDGVRIVHQDDEGLQGHFRVKSGQRQTLAIVAGENEPLVVPDIQLIDARIDGSDREWKQWAGCLGFEGPFESVVKRSALALKLLLSSPSGAIAAAATTSLPEHPNGSKNYDYRYAWVRDAGYTIKAFLRIGAMPEAQAAFKWLLKQLRDHGARVCYTLHGGLVPPVRELELAGYRGATPVVTGNLAGHQHQHGIYGDIFETAAAFVSRGNLLDSQSAATLSQLADECADRWRQRDAGIWELPDDEHYTMSKISCWQALARAVELADSGQMPTTCRDRWSRERDRIKDWIDANCWSEAQQAYVMYPGSDRLDASIALAVRFRFDGHERLARTLDAIDRELGCAPLHYRYSDVAVEEHCFLACTFWMAEARALLGQKARAKRQFDEALAVLDGGMGVYAEMCDPATGDCWGNFPQGLTHLALIQAAATISGRPL
ncbi:glycoside hydrolase family 15 protein [Comamonadaceae bacterium PP-2]